MTQLAGLIFKALAKVYTGTDRNCVVKCETVLCDFDGYEGKIPQLAKPPVGPYVNTLSSVTAKVSAAIS